MDGKYRLKSRSRLCRLMLVWVLALSCLEGWAVAAGGSLAQLYATSAPAVVFIAAVGSEGTGQGTGSIIDERGLVLTNAHVVLDKTTDAPAKKVFVFLKPERVIGNENNQDNLTRRHAATVVAYDKALDLALLKLTGVPSSLPVLPLGDPETLTIGSRVIAIGHPESGGLWTLTTGVISAEWKDFTGIPGKDIFQTETSLNRGNSGGPLIDIYGHQVGVNSLIARKAKDGLAITSINFAIKSSVAKEWLGKHGVQVAYAIPPREEHESARPPQSASETPSKERKQSVGPQGRAQPATVLENQPEAKPETGPGLPPLRPFSLDQLVKGLALVQKDLESQMEEMEAEIRKRR